MKSVSIEKIENGYIITKNTLMTTWRKFRPTISKTLLEEIKTFLEGEP